MVRSAESGSSCATDSTVVPHGQGNTALAMVFSSNGQFTPKATMTRSAGAAALALALALTVATGLSNAETPADSQVVISRDGVSVTLGDLRARMHQIPPEHRIGFLGNRGRFETLLRQLLEAKQIEAQARQEGLDQSERFRAEMRMGEMNLLGNLWNDARRREALAGADITQIARERYLASPPRQPARIVARHILIPFSGDDEEAARAEAEQLHRRVAAGESIEELAGLFSKDRSGMNGGLIEGPAEQFVPEFRAAVEALSGPGDLAPVTRTEFGYHVIVLVSKEDEGVQPFEAVRETLEDEVKASVARRKLVQVHERLFAGEVVINEVALDQLLKQPETIIPKSED